MQQAEYNHNDFSNTAEADKALMVKFFYKNVENKMESARQNRPVFKEKIYIELRIAGQRDPQACRPVTFADKQRFPLHFKAFEDRVAPPTEGMPLMDWPKITRGQAEELAFVSVKTVEQLASMKDSNLQQFMNGYKLRDQAVEWLNSNSQAVNDAEKAELKEQVARLSAQVEGLLAAAGNPHTPEVEPLVAKETAAVAVESEKVEGAAVAVPAAPGAKQRPRRKK